MTDNTDNLPDKQPPPFKKGPDGRIIPSVRGKIRDAMILMAHEGLEDKLAAERAGVRIDNLRRALQRPQNKAFINQAIMETRQNAGQRAFIRNVQLAQTSESDHVKADLNKWIAGVDNIAPIKRVEGRMSHTHTFGGFDFEEPDAKDITPPDD